VVGAIDVGVTCSDVGVDVRDFEFEVEGVVRGVELVVVLPVVGLGDVVVVVAGGPGLFARTALGENGG